MRTPDGMLVRRGCRVEAVRDMPQFIDPSARLKAGAVYFVERIVCLVDSRGKAHEHVMLCDIPCGLYRAEDFRRPTARVQP